jgi:hypothetical protein
MLKLRTDFVQVSSGLGYINNCRWCLTQLHPIKLFVQMVAIQTLTATATGNTITWYSAATGGSIVSSPTQVGVGSSTC